MKRVFLLDRLINELHYEKNIAESLIMAGSVIVNDNKIVKNIKIDKDAEIRIKGKREYVSRGAYKLLTAFDKFNIDIVGKVCLDVGSSTGGFTEVLLSKGASKVYCVDVGTNQLDYNLRIKENVIVYENTDCKDLTKEKFRENIDFAVMDVSFTSSISLIKHLYENLGINSMVILIKPQFEYKRLKNLLYLDENFDGVVKSELEREKIVDFLHKEIEYNRLKVYNIAESSIRGSKGNLEFLFYIGI